MIMSGELDGFGDEVIVAEFRHFTGGVGGGAESNYEISHILNQQNSVIKIQWNIIKHISYYVPNPAWFGTWCEVCVMICFINLTL